MAEKAISVKITRPEVSRAIKRTRLFNLLEDKLSQPVLWISSPGGSGKTMLVSSWLDYHNLPCIWYRCDEGDSDLATFFYYIGQASKKAAPRFRSHLPLLTPEYLSGIPAFTVRFFEKLYSRLAARRSSFPVGNGFFIVLDNYEDVPVDSPFHPMISDALDIIPEGIHVIVISRSNPPPQLARLYANEKIGLVEYGDIRFTFEESRDLVLESIPELDNETIEGMYKDTEGWAAGIILMLERVGVKGKGNESAIGSAYDRIFDYFAGEIFSRTEKETQDFLLKTAFLPAPSISMAEKLTGITNAGSILSTLSGRHFFTNALSGSGHDYKYHPLFRGFLLSRARSRFSRDEFIAIQRDAGQLLEQAGDIEESARLYMDAGDRDGLSRMIRTHARELIIQGRNKTVRDWLTGMPGGPEGDPWLLFWAGMCSFLVDMPHARNCLEKAFELFKSVKDISGIYLSWAGIVDTYTYKLGEWEGLDNYIAIFDELRKAYPAFPSREIDLFASSRMLISLIFRKTDQPGKIDEYLEHVTALMQENPSDDIRMDTIFYMSIYNLWIGKYSRNTVLLERAEAEIRHRRQSPPLAAIRVKLMKGIHCWVTAQYGSALSTLSEGLDIAEKSGAHVFDSLLWGFKTVAEMVSGHMDEADRMLKHQMKSLLDMNNPLDLFFFHLNSAWHAMLLGDAAIAEEHMKTFSSRTAEIGTPYYKALWNLGTAQINILQGRGAEARACIDTAHRISLDMKSPVMEWYSLLINAWELFLAGRADEGRISLERGLGLGKRHGYVILDFFLPQAMQFIYSKALEKGVEQEYVKGVIRKLMLTPPEHPDQPGRPLYVEGWPYPIKIFTLGRFEIIRDDRPVVFSGKAQKRPLELLKAIIAFGGRDVPEERVADELWPDVEGDLAHKSLETTLGRLRRLLGNDDFIRYGGGLLSINPMSCMVDSMALEDILSMIQKAPAGQVFPLFEKAVDLCKGPFLPSDTGLQWTVARRETLKNRMLRMITSAGRLWEEAGLWERAVEYYLFGLEMDNLAERFYQRIMICYQRMGNNAEAVKTYNRCSTLLKNELGIHPSNETDAIYLSITEE